MVNKRNIVLIFRISKTWAYKQIIFKQATHTVLMNYKKAFETQKGDFLQQNTIEFQQYVGSNEWSVSE